jgi:Helix-turn-helix
MMINPYDLPHNVLSVTTALGHDTIYRATPLSSQLGLKLGESIPSELAEADILLWVESSHVWVDPLAADEIRRLRLDLGLTQQQFADRFGVSLAEVVHWEKFSSGMTALQESDGDPVI